MSGSAEGAEFWRHLAGQQPKGPAPAQTPPAALPAAEAASAHADADELIQWLRCAPRRPESVFITHGEPDAAEALRLRVERDLNWRARVPEYRDTIDLT